MTLKHLATNDITRIRRDNNAITIVLITIKLISKQKATASNAFGENAICCFVIYRNLVITISMKIVVINLVVFKKIFDVSINL